MKKYEYRYSVYEYSDRNLVTVWLNELGALGWKLVYLDIKEKAHGYFMRELLQTQQEKV